MDTEQQAYEVPIWQLGWRKAQLAAQGYEYDEPVPVGGGIYIVVVRHPVGAQPFAYQPPHRRRKPGVNAKPILYWTLAMLLLAVIGYGLFVVFGPQPDTVTAETGGMKLDPVTGHGIKEDWWDWLPDLPDIRLPWPRAEQQPQPEPDGFRWPWDAAADTAESVQGTVTVVAGAVLAVLVLLIVLALVSKRR